MTNINIQLGDHVEYTHGCIDGESSNGDVVAIEEGMLTVRLYRTVEVIPASSVLQVITV